MKRLLVIDDSLELLEIFKILFETEGYEVHTISNGKKIIETIKKLTPHLILIDVYLAGQNGIDICAEIKSKPQLKDIPIIMMSVLSNLQVKLQACKPNAFISKPFNLTSLISVIEEQTNKVLIS